MTNSLTVVAKVFPKTLIFLLQKCEKLLQCFSFFLQCKSKNERKFSNASHIFSAMQKLLTFFQQKISMYRIQPNYRTVCFGFSKLPGNLVCDKICIHLYCKGILKERSVKDLYNDTYAMFFVCFFLLLIFFIKTYVIGTHLNCTDKSMQFKWVPITYVFIKK